MNYIYDILLNFKETFLDFYEWNLDDEIIHIRKIPLFRVSKEKLYDFKNGIVKIDYSFLKYIFNKTEVFKGRNKKSIKYCFLIGSTEDVLGVYLDNNGKIIYKSDLLIDEYEEVIEIINQLDIIDIKYEKLKESCIDFKTRNEKEKIDYILNHISNTSNDKLKYLYYECFDVKENDIKKIKNNILKTIDFDFQMVNKIYDFYKLLSYNIR